LTWVLNAGEVEFERQRTFQESWSAISYFSLQCIKNAIFDRQT